MEPAPVNKPNVLQRLRSSHRGFSLVELIVVISIMVLITTVVLVRHSAFNSTVLLNNLAYDVAGTIREAQVYATSVRNAGGQGFTTAYGVYFDMAFPEQFILFSDSDQDGVFTFVDDGSGGGVANDGIPDSGSEAVVDRYVLQRGHRVTNICRTLPAQGGTICHDSLLTTLESITFSFRRPNPDTIITYTTGGFFNVNPPSNGTSGTISIGSSDGNLIRTIEVLPTGQISVLSIVAAPSQTYTWQDTGATVCELFTALSSPSVTIGLTCITPNATGYATYSTCSGQGNPGLHFKRRIAECLP